LNPLACNRSIHAKTSCGTNILSCSKYAK
jgi:hypothetical protein